jgi:hypothetical protein
MLEAAAPFHGALITELFHGVVDDVLQQFDGEEGDFVPVGGEGEAVLGYFHEGEGERPDVGCDGVGFASNAFGLPLVKYKLRETPPCSRKFR